MNNNCDSCDFWESPITRSLESPGECRLTPDFRPKIYSDWCGQWMPKHGPGYLYFDSQENKLLHSYCKPTNIDILNLHAGTICIVDISTMKQAHPISTADYEWRDME